MKSSVSLLLAAACLSAAAAPAFRDVTAERFPDADAVVVDETERTAYNPDGTYVSHGESWTKVLTEKGRRDERTVSLHYSKRYGEAAVEYVGIVSPDGTERAVDVSATTKEATDNASTAANIYDPLDRRIVCTVPGLAVGDVLHVKTVRRALKPRCRDQWADISVMEWMSPILRSTYEVTAPKERPLRRIAVKHPLGNVSRSERKLPDGSTVHVFVCTNSPQCFPEPDMPPLYTQVQSVRVSTAADWREISRWYWNLSAPHLAKTNAALVAKARALRDVRRLYTFVSQEIRYMGLTLEDTSPGYAPHDVSVTFDNRYGVCRDKAALLVAMLRAAGHEAYPVLINVGAKHDADVPQPYFNHAIVAVAKKGGGYDLMDPTDENAKDPYPAYLGNCSYLVCRPEGETLGVSPVPDAARNRLSVSSRGTLAKDGALFLESDLSFAGINDTAYRHALVRKTPEERLRFFERFAKAVVPGAEIVRCDIRPADLRDTDSPLAVSLAARYPECVLEGDTRDELTLPFLSKALGVANFLLAGSTSLERRRYPLVLDATARVTERLEIDLAGNLGAAAALPPAVETTGGYAYRRTFAATNGTLVADRTLAVPHVEFDTNAYARIREDIARVEAAERRRPVFAKDETRDADLSVLLRATDVDVASDRAWTVTNTVVQEVLTYAGKKAAAELRLGFHPAVGSVAVLSAVVSNRDGRVSRVSARERNVLDAGWAASAPRYPAAKTLVVNLPAVEIGSVISYATVTTVTNAPAPYYGSFLLDSHGPLERRHVRVDGLVRDVVRPKRIPNEPHQPPAALWRDALVVTRGDFARAAEALAPACDVAPIDPETVGGLGLGDAASPVLAIRNWMARFVKVTGPGLYDLPLALQTTDPAVVLRERYATRFDYVRTLAALLRGAGYEADVVLAADNARESAEIRRRDRLDKPNVRAFATALCRVRERTGGFLGIGATVRETYLGTENEYAEVGASAYEGSDWFDPADGTFGVVTVPSEDLRDASSERSEWIVRPNGAVDVSVETKTFGTGVAGFRRTYAEMLPEERSRRHQAILGAIAQAASATGDLETDVKGYPAAMRFSCFIPDYAAREGEVLTLAVPPLCASLPSLPGTVRRTPLSVRACDAEEETVVVRFPEGFTEPEHLPEAFTLADPADASVPWIEQCVSTRVVEGALEVTLVRRVRPRRFGLYPATVAALLRDARRIADARANRTLSARRAPER